MMPFLTDKYGNVQSIHLFGQHLQTAVEEARCQTAGLINAKSEEVYFTSSGSEANNFAVKGLALAHQKKGRHIVLSAIEHQSVLYSAKSLEKLGFSVTHVPVDKQGVIDPSDVKKAIKTETILVSTLLASSEIGTVEPLKEIAAVCHDQDVLVHSDAVAAAGNIPVDIRSLDVDALSLSANQFYGPQGNAALFLKKGVRILPFIDGGIQESGRRAGTENVAGIVGMGKAAELARMNMAARNSKILPLRDKLIAVLPNAVERMIVTGDIKHRLPHHVSFCVEFIEGEAMLLSLSMKGIAASSGSACTSKALKASHVLLAIGLDHALAQGSLVFSLIEDNKEKDIDYLLDVFPPIIERLRSMSPLYAKYQEEK